MVEAARIILPSTYAQGQGIHARYGLGGKPPFLIPAPTCPLPSTVAQPPYTISYGVPVTFALTLFFLAILALVLTINLFGLPANWLIVGMLALWRFTHPDGAVLDTTFWLLAGGALILGEVLEFGAQTLGAKRYGSTGKGNVGGIIGAVLGAIIGASFLFGLGAFIGALGGAWAGCYLMETGQGRSRAEARQAAMGAMMGRFLGITLKCGAGAVIIFLAATRLLE